MRCPLCQNKLHKSSSTKVYETLNEHVCDPNGKPDAKMFFMCLNGQCKFRYSVENDVFWDYMGDIYFGRNCKQNLGIIYVTTSSKYRILWLNNLLNKLHISYNIRNYIAKYRCLSLKKGFSALDSIGREIEEEFRNPICRWILWLKGYKI